MNSLSKIVKGCTRSQGIKIKLLFVAITTIGDFESILLMPDSLFTQFVSVKAKKDEYNNGYRACNSVLFSWYLGKEVLLIIIALVRSHCIGMRELCWTVSCIRKIQGFSEKKTTPQSALFFIKLQTSYQSKCYIYEKYTL